LSQTDQHDLAVLIRRQSPLILLETLEEKRAVAVFEAVISQTWRTLYQWSVADGLTRLDLDFAEQAASDLDATAVLRRIREAKERSVFLLLDLHPYLKDPINTRLLREICQQGTVGHSVVLISPELEALPTALRHISVRFTLSMPDADAIEKLVKEEAYAWSRDHGGQRVTVSRNALNLLAKNLCGLTLRDARRLARAAIFDDGAIRDSDIPEVMRAKFDLLNNSGVLSYELETAHADEVGGLRAYRTWLEQRRVAFNRDIDLEAPKGVLLMGVQGCGKSLGARVAAHMLGIPLLRLDFGAVYNKFHGETERNIRESLQSASLMAPCVLWLDELEKGLATGAAEDGGTSQRVLGTVLTWMSEQRDGVFLVATANQVHRLPPELMRKGRFDEVFFVDLPEPDVRADILAVHLRKRHCEPSQFDLAALAMASDGFSGAELEQAVVSALYSAHARECALNTPLLAAEMQRTKPLSVLRAEELAALRGWAAGRAVPADASDLVGHAGPLGTLQSEA